MNITSSDLLKSVREDDFVEFFIFPRFNGTEDEEIMLSKYLSEINSLLNLYTNNYIWHKDEFNLTIRRKNSYLLRNDLNNEDILPAHLYGILHYGDNIEDEWFTTFLLFQISLKFNDIIIRVADNDGEFLLIEAANHLPSWANPDTCEKRVYIYNGKIHLVPFTQLPNNENVEVSQALEIIHNNSLLTEASSHIQDAIFNRISGYPEKIKENLHNVKLYLPIAIAAILNHKPGLISHAVTAFCNRDSIDMKVCRAMKYFPPENRVYTRVTFTKCLYAMITNSNYNPDLRTGWNLPINTSSSYKSHSLGIKVACGFEILASQAKPTQDLENDHSWLQYYDQLKNRDYFKGLLENSQEYNNLLNTAKDYYKNNRDMLHFNPILGKQILDLNKSLEYNSDDFNQDIQPDDDENWLQIDPKQLEKMLEEQYGTKPKTSNIVNKLNEFLHKTSDLEGIELPQDKVDSSPVRPKRGIKKNKETKSSPEKINFDASNFSCAVQNILDLIIPEDSWDLESGSELSEYEDEPEMDLEKNAPSDKKIKEYMDAMDKELASTSVFEKKEDKFDDIESFKPVDIDMSVLKNMLESYQAQMGGPGPTSNLLGPMGIQLEPTTSKNSDPK